jgi:hypothetical protein
MTDTRLGLEAAFQTIATKFSDNRYSGISDLFVRQLPDFSPGFRTVVKVRHCCRSAMII